MSTIILVVDDEADVEPLIKRQFRREIRSGDLSFRFASDGVEALSVLDEGDEIDVVLCDINMPRMDGLTLLKHLQAKERLLRTVMVSAYGDMANIRTAMNGGAFDFVTKPIDFEDLRLTIDKTVRDLTLFREALTKRRDAERARANLSRYFSPRLVDELAERDQPFGPVRRQNVGVLFADIVGFVSMTQNHTPEDTMALMNPEACSKRASSPQGGGTASSLV